ncbi:MAG: hypothetical protein HRU35_00525 [Rickettsiaceae bacterium]|nr:hypothetical protein [Rickettsiaceae bacterium]
MKKKTLCLLTGTILALTTSTAFGAKLAGAKATLSNVDSAIYGAVKQAERLYEENHGNHLRSTYSVLKNEENPYITILNISKDYKIEFQFNGMAKKGSKGHVTPVAKALLGKQILLIPIYNHKDEKITAWECLTNADRNVEEFMGSNSTKEFTASFIRDETDNKYLSVCTYINYENLFSGGGLPSGGGR